MNYSLKKTPQVSIGMPVYNGEAFISEALDSLLAQTFTDFELIISDNASTDGTEEICRQYAEKDVRVRYVRQAENRGALANFKFVLDEAVGQYFMWAAADDVWHSDWIKTLLPIASKFQCLSYGYVITIDEEGKRIRHPASQRKFQYVGSKFIRRLKYILEPAFLGKANPIYGILPKHALTLRKFNVLATSKYSSDTIFLYNILMDIEIKSSDSVYLKKRIHSGCAGGDMATLNGVNQNLLYRVTIIVSGLLFSHIKEMIQYWNHSILIEKLSFLITIPTSLVIEIHQIIRWRMSNKIK